MNFARSLARNAGLESVTSDSLSLDYRQRIERERTLVSASIELTHRCNLHCTHCYCPPGERHRELSTREIEDALDEMAGMGALFLLMTGGDPLLRKDFPSLYRHAKELGMLVTIFTNGTLIDDRIIELWDELPPSLIEISLYGMTRQVYEKVVAVRDSYDRCLQGIHRVLAAGHPLALKSPVTRENVHEIQAMADFARDIGVEFRYDPTLLATMDGRRHPHELRLSPREIVAFEAADAEKNRGWRQYLAEEEKTELPSRKLFTCGAGKNSLHIDPYGNVQVCLMVRNFKHSLREKKLGDIYRQDFPQILAIEREPDSKCGSCASRSTCDNCPGVALWETGGNQNAVGFQCELTAVRRQTYPGALDDATADAPAGCGSCGGGGGLLQIGGLS